MRNSKRHTIPFLWMCVSFCFLCVSCLEQYTFSETSGRHVTFSQDTIRFDTLFSGELSRTESFCVYNNQDEGVRLAHVRLKSGGASGYMINVDGQSGDAFSDIEIPKKDSIFVFVALNTPDGMSANAYSVIDSVLFAFANGEEKYVVLEATVQNRVKLVAQTIEGDKTITAADLPHVIYDSLVVASGATLRLTAGTTLYFHNGATLIVHGTLIAEGEVGRPVTLRGDRLDRIFSYLPYDRLENQWGGVMLSPSSNGCELNHTDIHSSSVGLVCDSCEGQVTIRNSSIHNTSDDGLRLRFAKATLVNTQVSNAGGHCVNIQGGLTQATHCTFAQFYPWQATRGHALNVSFPFRREQPDMTEAPSAHFVNCLITGYANDEVFAALGDDNSDLVFRNCMLMTNVSDDTHFSNCIGETSDSGAYKETHFKAVDTKNYYYDFHLNAESPARGRAIPDTSSECLFDKDGVERGDTPDIGCYQFKDDM